MSKPLVTWEDLFRSLPPDEWERLVNDPGEIAKTRAAIEAAMAESTKLFEQQSRCGILPLPRWP